MHNSVFKRLLIFTTFTLLFLSHSSHSIQETASLVIRGEGCRIHLEPSDDYRPVTPIFVADPSGMLEQAKTPAQRFAAYFRDAATHFAELQYVIDTTMLQILANENALWVGPAGNGKTTLASRLFGNILLSKVRLRERAQIHLEKKFGKPPSEDEITRLVDTVAPSGYGSSYFARTLNKESGLYETHGPPNWKNFQDFGDIQIRYDLGVLGSHFVFLDEFFDMSRMTLRNVLDVLEKRSHASGPFMFHGLTRSIVAATNKPLSAVYAEADGKKDPQSVIDRFGMIVSFMPELHYLGSYEMVAERARTSEYALPLLTLDDIEAIQKLVPLVHLPRHVIDFLALLHYQLKPRFERLEQAAAQNSHKQRRDAQFNPVPPYKAPKYLSVRTFEKAAATLKHMVVLDWVMTAGRRPLIASSKDIERLERYYTLIAPDDDLLETASLHRGVDPFERAQFQAVIQERQLFRGTLREIQRKVALELATRHLPLTAAANSGGSRGRNAIPLSRLSELFRENYVPGSTRIPMVDVTAAHIARMEMTDAIYGQVSEQFGETGVGELQSIATAEDQKESARAEVLKLKRAKIRVVQRAVENLSDLKEEELVGIEGSEAVTLSIDRVTGTPIYRNGTSAVLVTPDLRAKIWAPDALKKFYAVKDKNLTVNILAGPDGNVVAFRSDGTVAVAPFGQDSTGRFNAMPHSAGSVLSKDRKTLYAMDEATGIMTAYETESGKKLGEASLLATPDQPQSAFANVTELKTVLADNSRAIPIHEREGIILLGHNKGLIELNFENPSAPTSRRLLERNKPIPPLQIMNVDGTKYLFAGIESTEDTVGTTKSYRQVLVVDMVDTHSINQHQEYTLPLDEGSGSAPPTEVTGGTCILMDEIMILGTNRLGLVVVDLIKKRVLGKLFQEPDHLVREPFLMGRALVYAKTNVKDKKSSIRFVRLPEEIFE